MSVKMIVRVHPDDRVTVKVEGLTERDKSRPKPEKLCKKVTRRLEQDLGIVTMCEYEGDRTAPDIIIDNIPPLTNSEDLELGG